MNLGITLLIIKLSTINRKSKCIQIGISSLYAKWDEVQEPYHPDIHGMGRALDQQNLDLAAVETEDHAVGSHRWMWVFVLVHAFACIFCICQTAVRVVRSDDDIFLHCFSIVLILHSAKVENYYFTTK